MDEARTHATQVWLVKARNDLGSARKLASGEDRYLDTAIYHCQQAAEKAVKAYLVFRGVVPPKTHDVAHLVNLATAHESRFTEQLERASGLNPYATEFRYADEALLSMDREALVPAEDEMAEALQAADAIFRFVLSLVPQEAHPAP